MQSIRLLINLAKSKLTTLDDESDYFRQMEWAMVVAGIKLPSQNSTYQRLFDCYRIIMLLQFSIWVDRVYVAYTEWNSPGELIGVVAFCLALVMILSRAVLMRVYLKDLLKVRDGLKNRLNNHHSEGRVRSYRLIRRFFMVLEWIYLVDQIILYAFGINEERQYSVPDNLRRLSKRSKLGFDIFICSNHFIFSSVYASILTIMNTVFMGFSTELENIVSECDGIFERVKQQVAVIAIYEESSTNIEMRKNLLFWSALKNEISLIAERYSVLTEHVATVRNLLKVSFLLIFYTEIVFIGCALFYVKLIGITMNTVIVVSYVAAILLECYWFCRLADNINDTNIAIGFALYNLDWPIQLCDLPNSRKQYLEIRASLLVMMTRSQQNLGITCGGMFEMSAQAFDELMKMIYSCLMFLLSIAT
ncbi:AAEL016981-PA [Aedes aegypti]|uniref:Odorant receptor n=2 Tax=Aedes aegypti TaxID=7159 RepID=J9HF91_AEDAE|nr:odorant receptor 36 [Aedes aegypti]EJY57462.1 AAEL016981-PA [Aedes aegypti]DAA80380.1 TPA_exp: odorant receptor 36 [Aedes aegypti]